LAMPVFNENVALNVGKNVIWPDAYYPLTFYYVPKGLKTVDKYQWGFSLRKNVLQVGFTPDIDEEELELTRLALEKKFQTKKVKLIALECIDEKVEISKLCEDFTLSQECQYNPEADSAYLFYCRMTLNQTGEKLIPPML